MKPRLSQKLEKTIYFFDTIQHERNSISVSIFSVCKILKIENIFENSLQFPKETWFEKTLYLIKINIFY